MEHPIFNGESLAHFLSSAMEAMKTDVARTDTIPDLESASDALVAKHRIEPAALRRHEAEFQPKESERGVDLRVVIPLDGNARLLGLSPSDRDRRPVVMGVWEEANTYFDKDDFSKVVLKHTFRDAQPPTTNEVKEWAREQVDIIEKTLATYAVEVRAFNQDLASEGPRLMAKRQALLSATQTLKDDLGKGI